MIYLAAAVVGVIVGLPSRSVAYCAFSAAVVVAFIALVGLVEGLGA